MRNRTRIVRLGTLDIPFVRNSVKPTIKEKDGRVVRLTLSIHLDASIRAEFQRTYNEVMVGSGRPKVPQGVDELAFLEQLAFEDYEPRNLMESDIFPARLKLAIEELKQILNAPVAWSYMNDKDSVCMIELSRMDHDPIRNTVGFIAATAKKLNQRLKAHNT